MDLERFGARTICVDCDVLQADGGTRTAAITGAYVALALAVNKLIAEKKLTASPLKSAIAAVSVGIVNGAALLDLCYTEDVGAAVDMNLVMNAAGEFIELQGTGEEATFTEPQLAELLALGKAGIRDLLTAQQHAKDWDEIMAGIHSAVDIIAFQDGHVDFGELFEFLSVNKALADKHGLHCWTNSETFDRDMPIRFLPINWEKLRFKLEAARQAGYQQAITFEFSHFMSPNSIWPSAHQLYRRYQEWQAGKA